MKKILSIVLILVMALGVGALVTGCGEKEDEDALKVGFIYIGAAKDGGFSEAQDNGRLKMEKEFDGKVVTKYIEEVPENTADVKAAAKELIEDGCTVVVGASYGYMDGMEELSKEYPDKYFLHFSGSKKNDTNFDNYFGAMEEPRYLSGIVAGMTTKSDKIGYVAAYPYTEVQIGINAFALGVQSVNKDAEVKVVYINSWYDPAKEKEAAEALLSQGCDVMAQHCDTTGPILAAEAAGATAIGYNLDKKDIAPDTLLTAPVWNHEVYYNKAIKDIMDGKFKPESYYGTMDDGYVALAPLSDKVPQKVKDKVAEVEKQIKEGKFAPFQGEILYSDGTKLSEAGQTLTREEIWKINKVVKGVTSTEQK